MNPHHPGHSAAYPHHPSLSSSPHHPGPGGPHHAYGTGGRGSGSGGSGGGTTTTPDLPSPHSPPHAGGAGDPATPYGALQPGQGMGSNGHHHGGGGMMPDHPHHPGHPHPHMPGHPAYPPVNHNNNCTLKQEGGPSGSTGLRHCAGCGVQIVERWLLLAMDQYWHIGCLKCTYCQVVLGEIGQSCYTKSGMILCKADYRRKEDSTVFPFSVPITIPNLLNFVLANLNGDSHIEALINICQAGTGEAPDKCITRIRWLCLDIIEQLLLDYRKLRRHLNFLDKKVARNKRKIILFKLEHIKDIHLILGSTIDLDRKKDRKKAQLIKRKFHKYYKVIRLLEIDNKIERRHFKSKDAIPTAKRELLRSEL